MEKGTLVEFRHQNHRLLAVVQGTEGKKNLVLEVASGQTYSVHPRQIAFAIPGTQSFTPDQIPTFQEAVETLLDPENLAVAWELVQDDRQALELADMTQILFPEISPVTTYATHRLLSEDRIYFKQKGEAYEPRPSSQVKEIQHQMAVTLQREQEQAAFEAHLRETLANPSASPPWTPTERSRLECLERFALHGEAASDREQAIKLLNLVNRSPTPTTAFTTLVDLGIWSRHENVSLRLSGIPTQFPPDLEILAASLMSDPPPDNAERLDLAHLHTYTIDDAATRDIDDGLSIEWLPEGRERIWVHIADPTRWLAPGHPLDLEARRRGTSVYLPERVIPMFPSILATGPMSLIQGEVRAALSFGVVLGSDGHIEETVIRPSLIRVSYRLTYEDADEMLELGAERELTALAAAAQLRFQWRGQQGAIMIGMPEQDIKVVDEQPLLRVIEDTPARLLVAEMMVLAGEASATFASEHQIPIFYRVQPTPELPPQEELDQLPPGAVRSFALVRCMQRAEMTIVPARHAGLGLEAYTQVTSPIRRYADLISHFQIKAFLAGSECPFTPEDLKLLIEALEPCSYEAVQVERKSKRYWSLEYFRVQPRRSWRALVLGYLREVDDLVLAMIDEVAFRVPVQFNRHVELGEWVELDLLSVDPRSDVIEFRERSPVGAQS